MRQTRLLLSLLVASGPLVALLTACSGDDSATQVNVDTAGDAAPPNDTDGGQGSLSPNAAAVTVYAGSVAKLDASPSTGQGTLTYAWTIKSAPEGSAITTASLADAATATASFSPDKVGEYVLTLTVGAGGASATLDVKVTAVDPPVFYWTTENEAPAGRSKLNAAGALAGGAKAVACYEDDNANYTTANEYTSRFGTDWWEAPAGQPSKAVMVFELRADDDTVTRVLQTVSSNGSCDAAPTTLDSYGAPGPEERDLEQPRISPNGARVAYFRNNAGGARIVSIGFDGSKHDIAPLFALADGTPAPNQEIGAGIPETRPVWVNDTTIAWVQTVTPATWQVVTVTDADNATPTLMMTCTGETPEQFDILANGDVIVSQTTGDSDAQVRNIVVYPIDAGTKACGSARNISLLTSTSGDSKAYDFSLSPDKSQVAYIATNDTPTTKSELVVAAVDGSSPPRAVASPLASANRGPRWIGAGGFLSWGLAAKELDAEAAGDAIAVVPVSGGEVRAVATPPANGAVQAVGNGSCSFGPVVGSGMSAFGIAGLLALRLVRRRRKSDEG